MTVAATHKARLSLALRRRRSAVSIPPGSAAIERQPEPTIEDWARFGGGLTALDAIDVHDRNDAWKHPARPIG